MQAAVPARVNSVRRTESSLGEDGETRGRQSNGGDDSIRSRLLADAESAAPVLKADDLVLSSNLYAQRARFFRKIRYPGDVPPRVL